MTSGRRLLMIAHPFPPSGGGGVQRTAKFVKYLPEFGWDPIVLTVRGRYYPVQDQSLDDDVADAVVLRTPSLEPTNVARLLGRIVRRGGLPGRAARLPLALLYRTLLPDYQIGWTPFAVRAGTRAVSDYGCSAVYATGNPFSSFVIGARIADNADIPLVLDMRDPWTLEEYFSMPARSMAVCKRLEADVIGAAAAVVVVDSQMREMYAAAYPEDAHKIAVISNGFDVEAVAAPTARSAYGGNPGCTFTMLHAGGLYAYRRGDVLRDAIALACDGSPEFAQDAALTLVGGGDVDFGDVGLRVSQRGYVPHSDVVEMMAAADLLLLPTGGKRYEQTGKVFEYIAAGRHVLALAPEDGACADVLRSSGGATVVDSVDPAVIARALLGVFARWRAAALEPPRAPAEFERSGLTRRLGMLLDEVTST